MSVCPFRSSLGFIRTACLSLLLFALLGVSPLAAQQHNFHHYGTGAGLPQIQVFSITQDGNGNLWVGTYGGVGRYNGQSFKTFTTDDGLPANVAEALALDTADRLWIGTGAGLCLRDGGEFHCRYHQALDQAYVYDLVPEDERLWVATDAGLFLMEDGKVLRRYGTGDGLPDNAVHSVAVADDGDVWVGTANGLARHAEEGFQSVSLPAAAGSKVTALRAEADTLWVGTNTGLFLYREGEVKSVDALADAAPEADINDFVRDHRNRLWVASSEGIFREREGGGFDRLGLENGLPSTIIYSLHRDREGLVWAGHDNGMSKWLPYPFTGYMPRHGLLGDFVRTINEDDQGRLWLGTRVGVQIVPHDGSEWRFDRARKITTDDGLMDERIYAIDFTANGDALMATNHGVVRWRDGEGVQAIYTEQDGLPSSRTQAVWVDHAGGIWIGTNLGTVFLDDGDIQAAPHPGLARAYSFRIREDGDGRVWFATRDQGLFLMEGGEVRQYRAAEGLTDQTLWDIAPAGSDSMWIGSNGDGLFRMWADGRIERYTTEDGLVDDFVWQVLEDRRGVVWAYTNQGLARFDGERFQDFGRDDGLLHEEGGATGAWESHDGSLWFAAAEGLMRYQPDKAWNNTVPPLAHVERVEHGGGTISPGSELAHGGGSTTFHFASPSFQAESRTRFRYRLLGADEAWSDPIPARPITFAGLSGGEYVFEVEARNAEGVWSETPARFPFRVTPPFWQTPWFWLLVLAGTALLVWGIVRWRLHQSKLREQELKALVAERTRQLEVATVTDPLTGLRNRRFLVNQIGTDVAQSARAYRGKDLYPNRDIVFMMIDLDHFKDLNDSHGHLVGDSILKEFADIISGQLRDSDYVVRWGGEEFLVVARQTEASQLNVIVQRMIELVRKHRFQVPGVEGGMRCSCSIGVSHFPFLRHQPNALSWEQIVDIADTAVYMAKDLGRDGWVAIHGAGEMSIEDGKAFVTRIKTDLAGMVEEGLIHLESDFEDPLKGASGK